VSTIHFFDVENIIVVPSGEGGKRAHCRVAGFTTTQSGLKQEQAVAAISDRRVVAEAVYT
jgi:hypothetical protein